MPLDMFLQLDGIPGPPAAAPAPKGSIEVLAYSFGESKKIPVGTGTTKPDLQDISFTVNEDTYSPQLFRACVTGVMIKTATFTIYKASQDTTALFDQLDLTGVRVTALSSGGSGGEDRPTQNVTLDYQTIRYTVTNPPSQPQSATYSKLTNKAG
jgi:type VI secretion system secreted protein Hcp